MGIVVWGRDGRKLVHVLAWGLLGVVGVCHGGAG